MIPDDTLTWKISNNHLSFQKVLGISGSPRKKGNSDILLDIILNQVEKAGIIIEKVYLRELFFQPCIGCEKCRTDHICTGLKDGMSLMYPKILESHGIVLISPTHNYNVTAWVKAFIDRLYCLYFFDNNRPRNWSSQLAGQGRKAAIAAVCEQMGKMDMGFTLEAMRRPLQALGYEISGELPVLGIFDKGGVKKDKEVINAAMQLGKKLAASLSGNTL